MQPSVSSFCMSDDLSLDQETVVLNDDLETSVKANVPEAITKELKMAHFGDRRKIRLSTNWLPLMGFEAGTRHAVTPMGFDKGLRLSFDPAGPQQVYQRRYKKRCNNPFETVVEIGSQSVLDQSIPSYTERVHFEMRYGEILIRPLANHTFSIRKALREQVSPFAAMVAMTSGIDVRCLMDAGFAIDSVLEYRPPEKRDSRDLSETGALNVLANANPRLLFNEDISCIDWTRVRSLMDAGPQIAVAHISLQCDDFSLAKSPKLKERSLDNLSTTRDLVYDGLRLVETVRPACVILENVVGFGNASEGDLFRIKLRKWGYHVTDGVLNAKDFGGKTRRERYYLVASVFPGFNMPAGMNEKNIPIWDEIESFLPACRDVTHTKSLQDGLSSGRARLLTKGSFVAPTILKSQNRQAKDSVYISMGDGTYRLPSVELLAFLNGIPEDLSFNCVANDIASEIIGQSIDYPMHHALVQSIHDHIGSNVGGHTAVTLKQEIKNSQTGIQSIHDSIQNKRQFEFCFK
jgi:DNA (cytosine-5)-methyltransferase 1